MSRRWSIGALGVLAVLSLTPPAGAIAWGTAPVTVELGPGLRAERVPSICRFSTVFTTGCFDWRAEGFAMPPASMGQQVQMITSVGSRLVAAVDRSVVYSDDRGQSWETASFEGPQTPRSIAFSAGGGLGAVVGTGGALWLSRDRGATWRLRRELGQSDLVDVAVAGETIAVSSVNGAVMVSTDGGATTTRTLAERVVSVMPVMAVSGGAVWVRIEGRTWYRCASDGTVERRDRSPWG